jgi:cell division protein FtsI/penicillin-binding protein 2
MTTASGLAGQQRRVVWLAVVFAFIGAVLLGRAAWWQLLFHPEIIIVRPPQGSKLNVIPAARGSILDATGQYLVATSVNYKVGVSPRLLDASQREALVPKLVEILGRPEEEVREILSQTELEYSPFEGEFPIWSAEQLQSLDGAAAFSLDGRFRRVYPDESLAASLLGFVDIVSGTGQYGLEQYYDKELEGVDGEWHGVGDSWGEQILMSLAGYRPAKDGADLVLTLDRNIQHTAESVLLEGINENKASGGNILVLDPKTGAILAMANYPTYRPGAYGEDAWKAKSIDIFINTAISAIYEPGSVFKVFTLAAALETRVIRPTDTYDDRGEIIVGGQTILNSDRKAHGRTTMTELLAYSRNVGAAHVASLLGPTRFYEVIRRFGFSEITGVDLAIEVPGIMRVPGSAYWHMSDLGTNSFGQGIAATPLQVAAAYAAIANGGVLMRPYIVSELRDGDTVTRRQPVRVRRVISAEAAEQITKLTADALQMGLEKATLPGYRLAGKSGTAEIAYREGYQPKDVVASFVGFGPLPNPRFVILVKYDKPREGYWGGEVAAPEFRKMAEFLLDYYGIPPTRS